MHKRTGCRKPKNYLKVWSPKSAKDLTKRLTPRLSVGMVDEELPYGKEGGRKSWYLTLTSDLITRLGPVHGAPIRARRSSLTMVRERRRAGRANVCRFVRKTVLSESSRFRQKPSEPVKVRVGNRVGRWFAWVGAWVECRRSQADEYAPCPAVDREAAAPPSTLVPSDG